MSKTISVWTSMVIGGVVAFYTTGLTLGKPKSSYEANRNFWIALFVALLVFLVPRVLVWFLDKQGYTEAWKVGLLVFVMIVISGAIGLLTGF